MSSAEKIVRTKLTTRAYHKLANHIEANWEDLKKRKSFDAMRKVLQKDAELMATINEANGKETKLTTTNVRFVVNTTLAKEFRQRRPRGSRKASDLEKSERERMLAQVVQCIVDGIKPSDHQLKILRQIAAWIPSKDRQTTLGFQAMQDSKRPDPFRDPDFTGRHMRN